MVGAGLIRLKCIEGIRDQVADITVIDLADRILPRIWDNQGSQVVQHFLEKEDVRFYLSNSIVKFTKDTAILQDGTKLPYDVVVVAVGVRPNMELAKEAAFKPSALSSSTAKVRRIYRISMQQVTAPNV